ncbi:hypothetical protein FGU71_09365 [Erythrobacter insulae]|uniref:Uncharacterized protein n=1 Tax=Erythrobacter insulae TaxID=2584124 RepID=A0A547PD51_9SPHN|nr:hypothetical protein [Erythrobacter insulae]TRD12045.1 hypothetical protein FGU71_09365 [Erythrobacter insulae]
MTDPIFMIAATCVVGISVVAFALLRAWQGWLDLKREEMSRPDSAQQNPNAPEIEGGAGVGAARIEVADLKERIKKLEAIASGVEL